MFNRRDSYVPSREAYGVGNSGPAFQMRIETTGECNGDPPYINPLFSRLKPYFKRLRLTFLLQKKGVTWELLMLQGARPVKDWIQNKMARARESNTRTLECARLTHAETWRGLAKVSVLIVRLAFNVKTRERRKLSTTQEQTHSSVCLPAFRTFLVTLPSPLCSSMSRNGEDESAFL